MLKRKTIDSLAVVFAFGLTALGYALSQWAVPRSAPQIDVRILIIVTFAFFVAYRFVMYDPWILGLKNLLCKNTYRHYFVQLGEAVGIAITLADAEGPRLYGKLKHEVLKDAYPHAKANLIIPVIHAFYFAAIANLMLGLIFLTMQEFELGKLVPILLFVVFFLVGFWVDWAWEKEETAFFKDHKNAVDDAINDMRP